ncbi:MAG: thioredoxin family protein [Cyclobacteriaceae bacterium]
MRNSVCFGVLIFCTTFMANAQEGIEFRDIAWQEAFEVAKTESKLVFLEGYANWSQPCQILEQYTFADQEVGAYFNERFVNMRLDMEDMPGALIAEEYEVTSFPVLLFLDADGNVVHRRCGAIASDELLTLGEDAIGEDNLSKLDSLFSAGNRENEFLVRYSELLAGACMDTEFLVKGYFEGLPHSEWTNETAWNMINLNVTDPFSEPFQYLMSYHDMYSLKYGKDTVDLKVYNTLLDVTIGIYEDADLRLFATQALQQMIADVDFAGKGELMTLTNLKKADLKQDWTLYGDNALKVVKEQEVTDPDQLNEFAWKFYLFIDDKQQLEAAKGWMKKVLDTYPNATYFDSYASLLFKLGSQKEAVKYSERALQAAELELEDLMHYESQLKKFKAGK